MGKLLGIVVVLLIIGGIIGAVNWIGGLFVPESVRQAQEACATRIDAMWTLQSDSPDFQSYDGAESRYVITGEAFTGDDAMTAWKRPFTCTAVLDSDGFYRPTVYVDPDRL